jgi:two-component sensor histidine kinase
LNNTLIKTVLLIAGLTIVVGTLYLTQRLMEDIRTRETELLNLYADVHEYYLNSFTLDDADSGADNSEILFMLIEKMYPALNLPVITTDKDDIPIPPYDMWSMNIDLSDIPVDKQEEYMQEYVYEMGKKYNPLLQVDRQGGNEKVLQKIYYSDSELVAILQWFPIAVIVVIIGLLWFAYVALRNSRKSEESLVWVGMAKEAAHQLGTPLSSLMAWIEIIRYGKDEPEQIEMTIPEMTKDIERLNTIAKRFSKIGSIPDKEESNLTELIDNVCRYFELRLPHLGKKVDIQKDLQAQVKANINVDLLEWVIENLLKNASEAIEDLSGTVTIVMYKDSNDIIHIRVHDTGKGMTNRTKKRIFNAGFTTKKRGWGLGLALTKRIVEEYHNGKIYVKETQVGKGTTFAIELKG